MNHTIQQDWILNVIHDGLRDELDFGILQQNFITKMLMSFHDSSLARTSAKSLILDIICKMADMANPLQTLVRQHSLLLWLMHLNYDIPKICEIIKSTWTKILPNPQTYVELNRLVLDIILKTENGYIINELIPIFCGIMDKLGMILKRCYKSIVQKLYFLVSVLDMTTKKCYTNVLETVKTKLILHAETNVEENVISLLLNTFSVVM